MDWNLFLRCAARWARIEQMWEFWKKNSLSVADVRRMLDLPDAP